ncbi:hypothetical protein [Kaarinaea lacus]
MGKTPEIELTCLMDYMRSKSGYKVSFWRRSEIAEAVEMVIDVVDPKIRVLSRYNKRLRNAVDITWKYLDTLTNYLPPATHISRKSFSIDPSVRVLFENVESMLRLLNDSEKLTGFFAAHPNMDTAYVFLSMEKNERKFLGMELDGDTLKREVVQTAVTFTGHHLLSPALSEQDAKDGVKCLGFVGLLNKVNQVIMQSHYDVKKLEETKQDITAKIRNLKTSSKNTEDDDLLATASLEKLHNQLREVERDLLQARSETDSPDRHMQVIMDVLCEPEKYLKIEQKSLSVNNLGIKSDQAHVIEFAELEIEGLFKRVAKIVSFHRDDLS